MVLPLPAGWPLVQCHVRRAEVVCGQRKEDFREIIANWVRSAPLHSKAVESLALDLCGSGAVSSCRETSSLKSNRFWQIQSKKLNAVDR